MDRDLLLFKAVFLICVHLRHLRAIPESVTAGRVDLPRRGPAKAEALQMRVAPSRFSSTFGRYPLPVRLTGSKPAKPRQSCPIVPNRA